MPKRSNWEPYDPTWLVELARQQRPEERWLPEALAKCTRCLRESRAYFYFVDPARPNEAGAEWQFDTNITLESPAKGSLVLDILKGFRVGGVEFVDKIR